MMLKKPSYLCLFPLLITHHAAFAADSRNQAQTSLIEEEIVVTALRLDTTAQQSGASISIIDEELIRQRGYNFVSDAIVSASGVTLNQNGPFGGQASVRIRGASSPQTLVLIDGVPANDTTSPGGGFNFGAVDTLDVQSIEILKGPQSTLWGSDAIGGVVNIVSKPVEDGFTGNVSASGGSFGSRRLSASASAGGEIGDIRISYADVDTDGVSKADEDDGNTEDDNFDSQTLTIKGGLNLGEVARLDINLRNTEALTEFDGFGAATGVVDADEVSDTSQTSAQAALSFNLLSDRLENTLTFGSTRIDRENFSDGTSSFSAEGERTLLRYQGAVDIAGNQRFSFGYESEKSESGTDESTINGTFALYRINPIEDVTVSLGVRRDDHDIFGAETVGRVAAAWQVAETTLIHSSWGQGFKAPTIFQTTFFCCGATAANTALLPESSDAFDIGVNYGFAAGAGTIGLTYFRQDTENQIDFSFAIGGYENISVVNARGVELELSMDISDAWSVATNLSYINSEDGAGDKLGRLPQKTADMSLAWRPVEKLMTNIVVIYNDEEIDSRGTVDSWTRVDLSASYQVQNNIELFARIENLLDEDYQQIFGYGTPELSGYVGASYQF
ncbi:MAG: vitamin B12 transporter [Candidatus Azotimanducaceae bacterium]|jgi:vitamin B12 transporter